MSFPIYTFSKINPELIPAKTLNSDIKITEFGDGVPNGKFSVRGVKTSDKARVHPTPTQ